MIVMLYVTFDIVSVLNLMIYKEHDRAGAPLALLNQVQGEQLTALLVRPQFFLLIGSLEFVFKIQSGLWKKIKNKNFFI